MGYAPLRRHGYTHQTTVQKGHAKSPSQLLPHVHQVIALLKRWLMGTHHRPVTHEHLDHYLDEFACGFNRRTSLSREMLFFRLVQPAVAVDLASCESLVKYARPGPAGRPHNVGVT